MSPCASSGQFWEVSIDDHSMGKDNHRSEAKKFQLWTISGGHAGSGDQEPWRVGAGE